MPVFYESTIAPSTTRFFDSIQADPRLTSRTKAQLQGTLFSGVQDLEAQRMKMQEERDRAALRQLQYQEGSLSLEEAKTARKRVEDSAAKGAALDADLQSVMDSQDDYETKQAKLAQVKMKYADLSAIPAIRYKLDAVGDAIIKPLVRRPDLTPSQQFEMGQSGGDMSRIAAGDYYGAGVAAREAKSAAEAKKLEADAQKEQAAMQERSMHELLTKDIELQKPEEGEQPRWLEPKSHETAKLLVEFGTP